MSKKHYQALARAIYRVTDFREGIPYESGTPQYREGVDQALRQVISNVADVLSADNPRFDRARFIEACETGKTRGMRPAA